ncbi:hypothetical protein SAMN05660653_03085 [Desulfonatronum thiosulfatophilum]|uniref:Uncharacterized protein n=1 Tax=Desulfonatronum thiosulfatophilum TaxID=617002 RepID=A0A1G6ERP8_9BACT|nr:hypothetical protein SAMN05660653_03085 [Desulfonatronum thiosulfatophilum]
MSVDPKALLAKISEFYPELEKSGVDMSAEFDENKKAWLVKLRKDGHEQITHIEEEDAEKCMQGVECVHLGVHVADFIRAYCQIGGVCKS